MRYIVVLYFTYFVSRSYSDWTLQCSTCECKWMGGKKVANCSNAGISSVPSTLHRDIQVLYLDNNTITSLGDNVFKYSLPNLQKIYIRNSGLRNIHANAFSNLKILIEVDLSHNNISDLDRRTFSGNGRLKIISLAHNPIKILKGHQFPVLPYLKTIDLSYCQLQLIKSNAFEKLGNSIETIKLIGNKLKGLQEEIFLYLTNLKSLELHRNPWKCDCHLKSFREWVVEKSLYNYPTTCHEPERLAGKLWDAIAAKEFACKPKIEVSQRRIYSQPGNNASLGCFIKGNPMPEAKWVLRGRIVNNNTSPLGSNSQVYLIHQLGGLEQWFNLTVLNLQEDDADDYTCVAVNAGGVSEQNVTLTFDQPVILSDSQEPRDKGNGKTTIFLAVAGGCVVSLLSITLVSYMCCVSRRNVSHQTYSQNTLQSGCSSREESHLIGPSGILKQREYSELGSNKIEESAFTERGTHGKGSSFSSVEFDDYPDLLNIVGSNRTGQPQQNNTSTDQTDAIALMPDQVLDPTSLVTPCCTGSYTIPTAAILPPPPSFLLPYPPPPVQTVPLLAANKTPNFITLPRNQKRQCQAPNQFNLQKEFSNIQPSSCNKGTEPDELPPVPPPAQFITCCSRDLCDQTKSPNVWVKNSCQTLPHFKHKMGQNKNL